MKVIFCGILLFTILCSLPAFSQDAAVTAAMAACGAKEDHLKVGSDLATEQLTQPEAGKALIYVIEDDGFYNHIIGANITYRVGVDGAWAGGLNHHSPYLAISLSPGEHHLCANWQSRFDSRSKAVSLAHVDAQPDKSYYFRIRQLEFQSVMYVDLDPIDSDQGKLLIASSRPKK